MISFAINAFAPNLRDGSGELPNSILSKAQTVWILIKRSNRNFVSNGGQFNDPWQMFEGPKELSQTIITA
jgi:hypothetical protein